MDNGNGLVTLQRELLTEAQTRQIDVTPAAADHLRAWQVDQHVMALHESAHAVTAAALGLPVVAVDIKGKGHGKTEYGLNDDSVPDYTPAKLTRNYITAALAGWAAEVEIIGQPSTGSDYDLRTASFAVIDMLRAGMLDGAPFVSPGVFGDSHRGSMPMPPALIDAFGAAIVAEMTDGRARAQDAVARYRDNIMALARIVVVRRRLSDDDLTAAIREAGIEVEPLGE